MVIYVAFNHIFQNVGKCWGTKTIYTNKLNIIGIPLTTESGERVGVSSTSAAVQGISMVTISRIAMAAPGMLVLPVFMDKLEKRGVLTR